jgi:NAD(P)-dependent dehydrogenase (short-subunit alcohol dehydrogenase family)
MDIKGKIAIITGAASGIGLATARELVKHQVGAVALVDRSEKVYEFAPLINEEAGREVALGFCGDTTAEDFRKAVFASLLERYGPVNILIPAAGITRDGLAVKVNREQGKAHIYPAETFREVLEVNLVAPVYWALELVAQMAEDRFKRGLKRWSPTEGVQGVIVFIGSVSSQGNKGQIAYASTKVGLEGAASTLMIEAIFHGVRCAVIHPGFTDTPMVRALGEEYINSQVLPATQIGRLIRPEEIADAICFLVRNSAVSGQLWADAGWHPLPT